MVLKVNNINGFRGKLPVSYRYKYKGKDKDKGKDKRINEGKPQK